MKRACQHAVLAAFLVLPACATRAPTAGAAGDEHRPDAAESTSPDHAAHTDHAGHAGHQPAAPVAGFRFTAADVRFMQDMIGHHAQALVMVDLVPSRTTWQPLLDLAVKIDISQRDEIAMMKQWLADRKQAVPDDAHAHHVHMPGMLTDAQLAQLAAARGREFDRLFLEFMIQHHEGALVMVETLFTSPGAAQEPDIFRFATDVAADQGDEIFVMERMLDMLATNRGSEIR